MDPVAFADQAAVRSITEVAGHLALPKSISLLGQSGDPDSPTRQVDPEESEESRQTRARPSLDREKVRRHEPLPMPGQKLLPGRVPITLGRWPSLKRSRLPLSGSRSTRFSPLR